MNALHTLSAIELLAAYSSKALSPVEVTHAVLQHIEHCEPHIRATYALDPQGALAQAEASQARWLKNEPQGALDGVPVTIKENIATRGVPIPLGTAAVELMPAERDAPPTARLREAGAVILCKTTMPDYGMLSSGLSSFPRSPATPGTWARTRAAAAPVRPLRRRPVTARCTWAPTSAARCACLPAGAASSRSSPAWAASPSTRLTPAAWPGR